MQKKTSILNISTLVVLMLSCLLAVGTSHAARTAPNFALQDLKGKSYSLKQYRGKVVLVDFWASWCGPCRKSFPWMNKMQRKYGGKGFKILAINVDTEKELARAFLSRNKAEFKVLLDPAGGVAEKYKVVAMPSSFLIDKNGKIVNKHHGFLQKDVEKKEKEIQKLLR